MQSTTLIVAAVASVLVLSLRPSYALAAYIAVLVWYPDYLRVSIGTIDISAGRIVVIVLLLRCLLSNRILSKFTWCRLDTLVTFSMVVYVGIYCITRPFLTALENRGGFLMDTLFAYFAVRLIVTDKETLTSFIKFSSIALVALAILGMTESITHHEFFLQLKRFRPWDTITGEGGINVKGRWGLTRATGPFSHSIMFGSCMAMFMPLIWTLRHQRGTWGKLAYPLSGTMILGALSSMSSGPWVGIVTGIFCLKMEKYKRWVKPLLISFVMLCILLELASNRSFYNVLYSQLNFVGGDWYQRVRIINSAIEDFGEWWLVGYGGVDPGWGVGYGAFTDVNNEFIKAGIECGLLGIIMLCLVLFESFRSLVCTSHRTSQKELKSLCWSLGSMLVCIIVIWQGVSFFGTPTSLFYSILGIIGSSFGFAKYLDVNEVIILKTNGGHLLYKPAKI